ncbi:MAG: asparagine synthase (glutamine-hydrolyzing) [Nitrospirae bacterium]|nr:MAG: asparagine synthase (glutamine-hydrolyzing) [Nitrospirota bacterium]
MCGIAGLMYRDGGRVSHQTVARMCETLVHRGPDDQGIFVDRQIGIGMRRLNVIDLVSGHQPIANENEQIWVVFNGEIYNFQDLRMELENRGHKFRTHSDTETIVHAYEEYGPECVSKFNGMFAFAIWDSQRQRVMLARDRVGVKPLYYALDDRRLVFGSELKAILASKEVTTTLDPEALDTFLTFEYIPAPLSIFREIRKLPAGHWLLIDDHQVTLHRYWDLERRAESDCRKPSWDEWQEEFLALFKDAVRLRLISDVPLGAFLSGGVDSSAVVAFMKELTDQPVKTFSIGFDDPSYNELPYARQVATTLHTAHREHIIKPDIVHLTHQLLKYLDEPLADVSVFPTFLVSKLARQEVTVSLSGDGGDELFAGYEWYVAQQVDRYYQRLPAAVRTRVMPRLCRLIPPSEHKKGFINKLKRFIEGASLDPQLQHFRWCLFLSNEKRQACYHPDFFATLADHDACDRFLHYLQHHARADWLWRDQFADIKTYLVDDVLTKVDRMSMANSLEVRTPFLDYRVVEFAARMPSRWKLHRLETKHFLKKALASRLPTPILYRKKEGFSIPMKNWLKRELRPLMEDVLSSDRLKREGVFNPEYVETMKREHLAGSANWSHELWALMMFEMWRDHYLTAA